jgi:hypothetical protein
MAGVTVDAAVGSHLMKSAVHPNQVPTMLLQSRQRLPC